MNTHLPPDDDGGKQGEEAAADAAYPRLLGRNAGEELEGDVPLQRAAAEVGKGVVHPKEDEEGERINPVVGERASLGVIDDAEQRQQGKGDGYIQLRGEAECPVPQWIVGTPVELAHKDIKQQQSVEREHLCCLRAGDCAKPYCGGKHDASHCVDGAGHRRSDVCVHQGAELPQGGCCHDCEEEEGADGTIYRATYKQEHIDGTGQGADN